MDILIISQNFYPEIGSHASRITNMSLLLEKEGHNVDVLTSEPSYPSKEIYNSSEYWDERKEEFDKSNINVIRLKNNRKSRSCGKLMRLFYYFEFLLRTIFYILKSKKKYDCVIATSPQLFIGVSGIVAKHKFNAKFIFDIRDLWPESVKHIGLYKQNSAAIKLAYFLEALVLRRADAVVVNSEGFLPYLSKKGAASKSIYVPNGITREEHELNKSYKVKKESFEGLSIIYAGNIGLAQDLRVIVRVARELRRDAKVKFTILGTGVQEEAIKNMIKKHNLTNIEVRGALPKKLTLKEIGKHDLAFVNLKNEEVFKTVIPGKLIDYMSVGMPILAGVDGHPRELLKKAKCAFVTNPGDYKEMASIIKEIRKGDKSFSMLGSNGYRFVERNFIWEKNIASLSTLINSLVNAQVTSVQLRRRWSSLL